MNKIIIIYNFLIFKPEATIEKMINKIKTIILVKLIIIVFLKKNLKD